jgi:hypothetical protein
MMNIHSAALRSARVSRRSSRARESAARLTARPGRAGVP